MMHNVWFHSKYQPWEEGLISHFKSTGKWDKVIWSSTSNPDKTYVDGNNMTHIDSYQYEPVPLDLYEKIYPHLYVFCDMYARTSNDGSQMMYDGKNIHDYTNIFNMLVSYYHHHIKKHNINLLIQFSAPHAGRDFILYLVAKEMGVKTLMLEQSLFPNKFFYYFDHFDYGTFDTSKPLSNLAPVTLEKTYKKDLIYMREVIKTMKEKPSILTQIKNIKRSEEVKLLKNFKNKALRSFAFLRYYKTKEFSINAESIQDENFSFEESFVYFPLHLQPEKTTSSWGGKYCDQVTAIEHLSQSIPNDWFIYVKENPKQNSYFMRGPWFYKRLKAIPNVKVVPSITNTYALLEKCKFVATITGTVGWEAITGGKNALVFGWGTWYKKFPGCFVFDSSFSVDKMLNNKIEHEKVEEALAKLQTKMGTGVIYKGTYREMVDNFDDKENLETIIDSFEKILGYKNVEINTIQ